MDTVTVSPMRRFLERGGGWVAGQFLLLAGLTSASLSLFAQELLSRVRFLRRHLDRLEGSLLPRVLGNFLCGFGCFLSRVFRDFLGKLFHELFVGCHRGMMMPDFSLSGNAKFS